VDILYWQFLQGCRMWEPLLPLRKVYVEEEIRPPWAKALCSMWVKMRLKT